MYDSGHDLEQLDQYTKVSRAARAIFLFRRDTVTRAAERTLTVGGTALILHAVDHPAMPPRSDYVRAKILCGMHLVQPVAVRWRDQLHIHPAECGRHHPCVVDEHANCRTPSHSCTVSEKRRVSNELLCPALATDDDQRVRSMTLLHADRPLHVARMSHHRPFSCALLMRTASRPPAPRSSLYRSSLVGTVICCLGTRLWLANCARSERG